VARFRSLRSSRPRPRSRAIGSTGLTRLEQFQVQVAAAAAADAAAAGVVAAGALVSIGGLLHRPGSAALELLQEAVDLVLDAGGRARHPSDNPSTIRFPRLTRADLVASVRDTGPNDDGDRERERKGRKERKRDG